MSQLETVLMAKSLKLIVESMLYAAEKPLSAREIHSIIPDAKIPGIKSALKVLQYEYEAMGRSFSLREVANGYQFRSRSEYGAYIMKMLQRSPNRLSRASMETLAIIAYKQPILRQEIERLRGVDVGGIVRALLEKDLIRVMGRKNLPGRPLIYGTTKKFLEVFDLKDIESLPKLKEFNALGGQDETQSNQKEIPFQNDPNEDTLKQETSPKRAD
jgi:segregation and condensation protein B